MSRRLALFLALSLGCAGCGGDDDAASSARTGTSGTITVFAAASLTESFTELGERFERAHERVNVELSFAASSELVTQIVNGAPADVFASADEASMGKLIDAGAIDGEHTVFARNRLAIAVEPGNPEAIRGIADLGREDLVVVLCAEQVPCGTYADEVLTAAEVDAHVASREESVKAALSKVELGEADAAIVYATDVIAGDGIEGVEIPDDQNVVAVLPIGVVADTDAPALAAAWIEFVTSTTARSVLTRDFGFLAP